MKGFKNVKAYLPEVGVVTTNIGFENGKIVYIGDDASQIESIAEVNGILVPGFIDQHIHGAGGSDGMDGTEKDLQIISETIAREGTTGFLATTMTQSPENISKAMKNNEKICKKVRCIEKNIIYNFQHTILKA
jgi:N-acetylglucosamine-6-phosphate deacetylase